ncbi:MAG TPA: hypothetical protein VFV47_03585 [Hyphomicrobiaceae bacterium]|nr:hypothetical protein [Hyphomicrobiaceae bacterium]
MFVVRVVGNTAIVAIELAAIAGAAWLAWRTPAGFAGLTALLAFAFGLSLELARIDHEVPFYFERAGVVSRLVRWPVALGTAIARSLIAGGLALITFSGTASDRLWTMAAIFAVIVFLASSILRRMAIDLGARPARWGYFRLAVPLGILYSLALSFFPAPSTAGLAWQTLDFPARPSIAKAGELLFAVRLWVDDLIVRVLAVPLGVEGAQAGAIVISSNVLTGFVLAVWAVAVSELVRVLEEAHWRLQGRGRSAGPQ